MLSRSARAWTGRWSSGGLLLVVLCGAVYLPGLWALPAIDRDESRFAQASRQMFQSVAWPESRLERTTADGRPGPHSGGLAIPMVQDRPRLNKPPLIYWLQTASAAILTGGQPDRDAIWMYRVPSVLCAVLAVLATWRLGLGMFDPRAAWLGAALLAICPMVVWDAHQARADQLLLATVTVMQLALWRVYSARPGHRSGRWDTVRVRRGMPLLFWAALAASVLAKGPIGPMVAALTVLAIGLSGGGWAWLGRLRWAVGVPLLAVAVGLWVGVVVRHIGWDAYLAILNDEVLRRATVGSAEGHAMPPGTHLVLLAALFWPGSLLTLAAFGRAFRVGLPRRTEAHPAAQAGWPARLRAALRREPGREAELFLLAWLVPAWVAFELFTSKLPHYTMPMYPAVALLSARMVLAAGAAVARGRTVPGFSGAGAMLWAGIGLVPAIGAVAITPLVQDRGGATRLDQMVAPVGVAIMLAGVGLLVMAAARARRGDLLRAQVLSIPGAVLVLGAALQVTLPRVAPGATTAELAAALERIPGQEARPIGTYYHEDSIVFATRGRAVRLHESTAAWVHDHPGAIGIVPFDGRVLTRPWRTGDDIAGKVSTGLLGLQGETWLVLTPPLVARPEADAPPATNSGSARPEGSQP
ncbi:MAG: glycosyltransferase family 39 protein [Planctomycetaceae bacterium]|jgi:4-amino-4-deoxy-L-arabinose transferase-like glycosyltransferase|nr:glycosyltransferase family 39 protein [Phycisphaerales bacterium]MCE2652178.1 glycosyltransferase family 39 protein [Planctomycetaceae bacterium]